MHTFLLVSVHMAADREMTDIVDGCFVQQCCNMMMGQVLNMLLYFPP